MNQTTIILKDPFALKLHRLQKILPDPDTRSAEWVAFLDSIHSTGVIKPLIINPEGMVIDGGRRWRAARQLELESVPCLVRPDEEASLIIFEGIIHHKPVTRDIAVYLLIPMLGDLVKSANDRRLANLNRGNQIPQNPLKVPKCSTALRGQPAEFEDYQELCSFYGIPKELLFRAFRVHRLFESATSWLARRLALPGTNYTAQWFMDRSRTVDRSAPPLEAVPWSSP
jgi:hypothetical protein